LALPTPGLHTGPATHDNLRARSRPKNRAPPYRLAAYEFIVGPLLDKPHRVGKRLHAPLEDRHSARRGTYRVICRIDDENQTVSVVDIAHRRDAYRVKG